jgi:hypothetical protein
MKPNYSRFFILGILLMCSGILFGQKLNSGNNALKIEDSGFSGFEVKIQTENYSVAPLTTVNGNFIQLTASDLTPWSETGTPNLPVYRKIFQVPEGAEIVLEINSVQESKISLSKQGWNSKIIPVQLSASKSGKDKPGFALNRSLYNTDKFYGREPVFVEKLGKYRGVNLYRLTVFPFTYNPIQNELIIRSNIVAKVRFSGSDVAKTTVERQRFASPYEGFIQDALLNSFSIPKDTMTRFPVKYVIVADPMFQQALQPFIQWKTKKGFKVIEAYTNNTQVGTTTTSIKNYLTTLYNSATPADPAPSFLLIVGDVAQIPTFTGTTATSHKTDLFYAEYTNDFIPELYYGRFSATNINELNPQIEKTLEYEQYLMVEKSFLNRAILIAGVDGANAPTYGNGQLNYLNSTYYNSASGYIVDSFPYPATSGTGVAAQIIQKVSDGVSIVNYTAHGSETSWSDPSFSNTDVSTLQNQGKYPLMIGNCCLSNSFDQTCLGETLLRAAKKGAIGYIGASDLSYWDEDYYWAVGTTSSIMVNPTYATSGLGAFDRLLHTHNEPYSQWYAAQGQMTFAGNLAVAASGSTRTNYYWEIYQLMGDPSLMVYQKIPPTQTVNHPATLPIGINTVQVYAEPYSYVAISMNGVLHGAAQVNANGIANVNIIPFTAVDTADVVVTAQFRQPYFGRMVVEYSQGPYVSLVNNILDDATGNNNQKPDPAETLTMSVEIKNFGIGASNSLQAVLSTADTNIMITDSTETVSTIAGGAAFTMNNAFAFFTKNNIQDQHVVNMMLKLKDNQQNSWSYPVILVLNAPELKITLLEISDPLPGGNNNNRLDPGESAILKIGVLNNGHSIAQSTLLNSTSSLSTVVLSNTSATIGTMQVNATQTIDIPVQVSSSVTIGTTVNFTFNAIAGYYSGSKAFPVSIGLIVEDFETGNFTRYNWDTTSASHPWTLVHDTIYEGSSAARSATIDDSQESILQLAITSTVFDSLSFYYKVSSEYDYDKLMFYIDNVKKQEWSGEIGWTRASFPINTGAHTFKWRYKKDSYQIEGADACWIDFVVLPALQSGSSVSENLNISQFMLSPVPTTGFLNLSFSLQKSDNVTINLLAMNGQVIQNIRNTEKLDAGQHYYSFDIRNLSSGSYMCVIKSGEQTLVKRIILNH